MLWICAPSKTFETSLWYPLRTHHLSRMPAVTSMYTSQSSLSQAAIWEIFFRIFKHFVSVHLDYHVKSYILRLPNLCNFQPGMLGKGSATHNLDSRFSMFCQILIKIQDLSEDLRYFKSLNIAVNTKDSRFGKSHLEFGI